MVINYLLVAPLNIDGIKIIGFQEDSLWKKYLISSLMIGNIKILTIFSHSRSRDSFFALSNLPNNQISTLKEAECHPTISISHCLDSPYKATERVTHSLPKNSQWKNSGLLLWKSMEYLNWPCQNGSKTWHFSWNVAYDILYLNIHIY